MPVRSDRPTPNQVSVGAEAAGWPPAATRAAIDVRPATLRPWQTRASRRDRTAEVTELLQQLIRNACVNDGTPESGHEPRSVDLLRELPRRTGARPRDLRARAGSHRASSPASRAATRTRPTLLLMGHTDVVPANADDWRHDPFGGELVDGEVWGRGAVDMLNLTASMAVATRHLADSGFRPKAPRVPRRRRRGGSRHATARSGWPSTRPTRSLPTTSSPSRVASPSRADGAQAAGHHRREGHLLVHLPVRGTPGPRVAALRTDNALVKAAEVVRRLAEHEPAEIHDVWRRFVEGWATRPSSPSRCSSPRASTRFCEALPLGLARQSHACTHTTMAPTVVHGGDEGQRHPRRGRAPGRHPHAARAGPATTSRPCSTTPSVISAGDVEIIWHYDDVASASPIDTPLWDALEPGGAALLPEGAPPCPFLTVGATDARFFRRRAPSPTASACSASKLSLRGLRRHVPRRRRARRRRVAGAVDRPCGTAWPATCSLSTSDPAGRRPSTPCCSTSAASSSTPVRDLRPLRGGQRAARRVHPLGQRHQPPRQRLGAPRAQRDRLRRVLRRLRGRGPGAGGRVDARHCCSRLEHGPPTGMVEAVRRCGERLFKTGLLTNNFVSPGDTASGVAGDGTGPARRRPRPLRRGGRVVGRRGTQARPPLLPDGLRAARHRAAPGRLPRRPRRQPEAGTRPGHDHHQGRDPDHAIAELEDVVGISLR